MGERYLTKSDSSPHDIAANVAVVVTLGEMNKKVNRRLREKGEESSERESERREFNEEKVPVKLTTLIQEEEKIIWTDKTDGRTDKPTYDRLCVRSLGRKNNKRKNNAHTHRPMFEPIVEQPSRRNLSKQLFGSFSKTISNENISKTTECL